MLVRTLVVGFVILLVTAGSVNAQQDITSHSFSYAAENGKESWTDEDGNDIGLERGKPASGFVHVTYCWDGPGANPNNGKVYANIEIDQNMPSWLTAAPVDDTLEWIVGDGPVATEGCGEDSQKKTWEIKHSIAQNAPYGAKGAINYTVTITQDDDIGTYESVEGEGTTGSIEVVVEPRPIDPITGEPIDGDDGTAPTDGDGSETPEESPGPMPLAIVLTAALFLALRRRV